MELGPPPAMRGMIRRARAPSRTPGHAVRSGRTLPRCGRDLVQISWNPKPQQLTENNNLNLSLFA
jgi:hypothetical protein